jgi:hypothetical protein
MRPDFCEAGHIRWIFFTAWSSGTRHGHRERVSEFGIVTAPGFRMPVRQGQAMGQQLQSWRSGDGEKLWLSMLIDAMEGVSRPEFRKLPCEPSILAALRAQLARPASPCAYRVSQFSLRN